MSKETPAVQNEQQQKPLTIKSLFSQDNVRKKFEELMGERAPQFMTSVLQSVASNEMLKNAEPNSVFHAAAVAATLNLPINNSLGFAYIVPYNDRKSGKVVAQFQMGYKGFIQLAQRSGQFLTISAAAIHKGQLISENPLTGFEFDFTQRESDEVIGYAAYFKLLNGFEKTLYMSADELKKHGTQFSQSFRKGYGLWKDNFDSMAQKTVIKLLLSKFAPLSIEMQKAVKTDSAVVKDDSGDEVEYVDVTQQSALPEQRSDEEIEADRMAQLIDSCTSWEELEMLKVNNPDIPSALITDAQKKYKAKK